MSTPQEPPQVSIMKLATASWVSQAVGAAARLSFADHIHAGATTAQAIAERCGAPAEHVNRVLRALASLGVFTWNDGHYGLTPVSDTLRVDSPFSMRAICMAETDQAHWLAWGRFTQAVSTGQPQAREALGMEAWEWYGKHPEDGKTFSQAMGNLSGAAIGPALSVIDVSAARKIVDVGGAHGHFLAALLRNAPAARGVLFDLPHVVATARASLAEQGLGERVEVVPGSFFEEVPGGGDVYLLKHIIHDWDDARSLKILENVRNAMPVGARLFMVEMFLPPPSEFSPAHLLDLNMMVVLGGKERTPEEIGALCQQAGLELVRCARTPSPFAVYEATRR